MKVVLDTNIIIAAYATRGLCLDIFELCLAEHRIVLSQFILQEVRHVLARKLKLPHAMVNHIQQFLSSETDIIVPAHVHPDACRDKNDLKILGTAVAGKVDAIITGDKDLLDLDEFESILIFSPREFWNLMQSRTK